MAVRVVLKKKWKPLYRGDDKPSYRIGTILQVTPELGSELIRTKVADKYIGDYPPKEKVKINLEQLNNK